MSVDYLRHYYIKTEKLMVMVMLVWSQYNSVGITINSAQEIQFHHNVSLFCCIFQSNIIHEPH